jgi:flagellar biosynthesis GTPase FlhF
MERRYNDNYVNGTDTIDFRFENGAEVSLAVDATTNTDDLEAEARRHAMRNARMELTSDTARSTVDTARQRMDAMSQQMANNQEQMQSYTSYFEAAEQRMAQRQEDISSGSIRPFGQVGISEPPPRPKLSEVLMKVPAIKSIIKWFHT